MFSSTASHCQRERLRVVVRGRSGKGNSGRANAYAGGSRGRGEIGARKAGGKCGGCGGVSCLPRAGHDRAHDLQLAQVPLADGDGGGQRTLVRGQGACCASAGVQGGCIWSVCPSR
eukprot:13186194-Alexandrium_andersonii.AAC.1